MTHPSGYREQSACANCAHVFRMHPHDDPVFYFCTKDAPPRPKCGNGDEQFESIGIGDRLTNQDELLIEIEAWDAWREGREVQAHTVCDAYEVSPDVARTAHLRKLLGLL